MIRFLCLPMFFGVVISVCSGQDGRPHPDVQRATIQTIQNVYTNEFKADLSQFPIGLFDSGTGGLTVLEQILKLDLFDNDSNGMKPKGDGKLDFDSESFVFLADQANMPYGNYPIVGKQDFLDDLILRDARFLLGRKYDLLNGNGKRLGKKPPVKAIVIACNTATAYGKPDIEDVLKKSGSSIKVIGVIDAGAEGALEVFSDGKSGTIGVVPTKGTVLSNAYPVAIRRIAAVKGLKQEINVIQQGAYGLAGAIDKANEFIDRKAKQPRQAYRGPSLTNKEAKIDFAILRRYDFDFSDKKMLFDGTPENPMKLQLNSAENYLAYHLVSLLEKLRRNQTKEPLRAIIMGCTHFPFIRETFRAELDRLYDYREDGKYIYRPFMAKNIELIDPAYFTARNLYQSLVKDKRLAHKSVKFKTQSRGQFFISVPCSEDAKVKLNKDGTFTYEYKYGRVWGQPDDDYQNVPLDDNVIGKDEEERLRTRVPGVWSLLQEFRQRKN